MPKVKIPKVDSTLSRIGTGFLSLIARGIDDPPRMIDARRESSTP